MFTGAFLRTEFQFGMHNGRCQSQRVCECIDVVGFAVVQRVNRSPSTSKLSWLNDGCSVRLRLERTNRV